MAADGGLVADRHGVPAQRVERGEQPGLVALGLEDEVRVDRVQGSGVPVLSVQCVCREHHVLKAGLRGQPLQQLAEGGDLIALLGQLHLTHDQLAAMLHGRQQPHLRVRTVLRAPQGLAVHAPRGQCAAVRPRVQLRGPLQQPAADHAVQGRRVRARGHPPHRAARRRLRRDQPRARASVRHWHHGPGTSEIQLAMAEKDRIPATTAPAAMANTAATGVRTLVLPELRYVLPADTRPAPHQASLKRS
ncbi:hypothetical protein C4B68_07805 [Streptomyces dengpaensis]|uniref:Uncharacterized protein n=1 Tax=Streptomyces dengpaensis TaxID=2049881 RepID=A0ABM6SLY9_9ACTN|nr:hypothetical protein C4B68_07805 [Streptomyces dengpaensis]